MTATTITGSIVPNRTEVSRDFPVLSFTVRTPTSPGWFEIALATSPALLEPAGRDQRTPSTFWSSHGVGPILAERGESVFLVPGPVLRRFAGAKNLFFALATFESADGSGVRVWRPRPDRAPSVAIASSFASRRVHLQRDDAGTAGYGNGNGNGNGNGLRTWVGDSASPPAADEQTERDSMQPSNGHDNGTTTTEPQGFSYDDGLGLDFWNSRPMSDDVDPDAYGIEGPVPEQYSRNDLAAAASVPVTTMQNAEYPQASRFAAAATGNFLPRSSPRTIDKIVIHITDGGADINGTIRWFQDPSAQVSSHYLVGQDGEVVQLVRHDDVAYHARGGNSHSIGIEHSANTRGLAPTEAEYCASAALVNWLCTTLGIPMDRTHIQGHREAVQTSKTCPGDWDWDYFMGMVTSATCYPRASQPAAAQSLAHSPYGTPPPGYLSRPFDAVSVRYDDAYLVPQPTGWSCWAAAAATVVGWREMMSIDPSTIATDPRFQTAMASGLSPADVDDLASAWGLHLEAPMCYTVDGFRRLLEDMGPLWVGVLPGGSGHAVTVIGLQGDGTPDGTKVIFHDPWPPGRGVSASETSFTQFMRDFENLGAALPNDGNIYVQIVHANGRRSPLTLGLAHDGARPMGGARTLQAVEVASAIAGAAMTRILDNEGDITWSLDQLNGWKHPSDAPRNVAATQRRVVDVQGPTAATVLGVDEIYVRLRVEFDYDGSSVGNISQQVTEANDAAGAGLTVSSTLHDLGQLFPSPSAPQPYAGVRIQIHHRFTGVFQDDKIGLQTLTLYGNGTFDHSFEWTAR